MPLGVAAEFSDEEAAALEALRDPNEQPLDADTDAPGGAGDAPGEGEGGAPSAQGEGSGQPATDTQATGSNGKQQQKQERPVGDLKQALRASRRAEQRAREEVQRLREENERLSATAPQKPAAESDELTDADLDEIAADYPAMAKVAKAVRRMAPAAAAQEKPQPTTNSTEFVPPVLPADLQEVVDDIPDLLAWQNDPDQTRFEMAKAADVLLLRHPKWKDKPDAERLAEVARRVNKELAEAAETAAQRIDPAKAIENAPTRQVRSMSDIGGGGGRDAKGSDLARFASMSADDVEAELMARG